ncbi:hypothetical protein [Nocardia sp. CA-290969]|uniref:hypothetical protein n=1 Tax=Nocardia sp. CA-290969 TaxID=3239986 RepID=UPI003D8B8D5C
MGAALARLRANEPIRLVAYPALLAVVVYLVGRGWVAGDVADIITGVAALLLGVPAAEAVRSHATPDGHLRDAIAIGTEAALDQVENEAVQLFGPDATALLAQIRARVAELHDAGVPGGRHRAGQ